MHQYDFSKTFEVLVGPEKKLFTLHHDLITSRSKFFRVARSSHWTADSSKSTDLVDYDSTIFSLYLQCVYTGSIAIPHPEYVRWCAEGRSDDKTDETIDETNDVLESLIKLYSCADKLEDLTAANLAIDELVRFSEDCKILPTAKGVLHLAYESTPSNNPLRELLRDWVIHEASEAMFALSNSIDVFPKEMLFDIVKEFNAIKHDGIDETVSSAYDLYVSLQDKCHYHQHNDEHQKCK